MHITLASHERERERDGCGTGASWCKGIKPRRQCAARERARDYAGSGGKGAVCVCEIQPSCSAGNNGREASVEMQIRARVADSLIHVRGLWFRAMRTAAYTRGIKEFVLEFCSPRGKGKRTGRILHNVTRGAGYPFLPSTFRHPSPPLSIFLSLYLYVLLFLAYFVARACDQYSVRHPRRVAGNDRCIPLRLKPSSVYWYLWSLWQNVQFPPSPARDNA